MSLTRSLFIGLLWYIFALFLFSCGGEVIGDVDPGGSSFKPVVPEGFPKLEYPEDNRFTNARWQLGRKLFYDPVMSRDSTVSCSSCHKQSLAFADNLPTTPGVDNLPGVRNSPSLGNIGYHPYYTREGGVPSLEMQVLVPIQEHNEFGFNILLIQERLMNNDDYIELSKKAYDRNPDYFVITRALATFERSLISGNSAFDQYKFQGNPRAISKDEIAGMELFYSARTNCATCHEGFNFTNYSFQNNGLYLQYADTGRQRLTGEASDRALFKVPSLRNVGLTGPYMHDGTFATLDEVIKHYNTGGKAHPNKSPLLKPLHLTGEEQQQLVAFLESLTDYDFISNPNFQKP